MLTMTPAELTAHLLKSTPFRSTPVTLPDGTVIHVREPSFKQRSDIYTAAMKQGGKEIDVGRLNTLCLIHLAYTATGVPLFTLAHKDTLEALPVSHPLVGVVAPACVAMLSPTGDGGNGEPTIQPSS